jgi:hypothetical protein
VETKCAVFVVGHENWGKSQTLRALIDLCNGQGKRVTINGTEFLLRIMSNDDQPAPYHTFMKSTRRPYFIAAFCPKFTKLQNYDHPRKPIDRTLQDLQRRGYRLFFWVIRHKWNDLEKVITSKEVSELRRYGTVEIFVGQDVKAERRASHLRSFVAKAVLG